MLPPGLPPSWVKPGAKFDFDFANGRYWGGNVMHTSSLTGGKVQTLMQGPGNGVAGYAERRDGVLTSFPAYHPRIANGTGLWTNRNNTNLALWCRDFTNAAWVKTNVTATKNQAGADGGNNSASSLAATSASGTVLQTIVNASATVISSAYIKRLSGTGTIEMTQDNGSTWTDITSLLSTSYTLIQIPSAVVVNPVFGFRITTSGDSIAVDFFVNETGTKPTTPLLTTTATVARFNEEPTFNDPSANVNGGQRILKDIFTSGGPWCFYGEYAGDPQSTGWFLATDSSMNASGGCDGSTFSFNGATSGSNGTAGRANLNKVAGRCDGFGSICCINGGAMGTYVTSTNSKPRGPATAITHCGVGNNGSGTSAGTLDGYIGRMVFWDKEIPDGQLIEYTR